MLSNSFVRVTVDRYEAKGNLRKNRLADKTNYYKSSQTRDTIKWDKLNQIKESKNSFVTTSKLMWRKIKTPSYLKLLSSTKRAKCSS